MLEVKVGSASASRVRVRVPLHYLSAYWIVLDVKSRALKFKIHSGVRFLCK